jgi:ribosome maturation factor RimP
LQVSEVEEILKPYLDEHAYRLYEIKFVKEAGMNVLRVLVNTKDGINVDQLAEINHFLSEALDEIDKDMGEYMLEVSSPGAECELRNEEEIKEAVGKYVHVNAQDTIYEGSLESFENGILVVRVNLKGRFKNFEIPYENVRKIRNAVKF